MRTKTAAAGPRRLRRLLPVALLATPVAFTGIALANPATACAERIWDIGAFDSCANNQNLPPDVAGDPERFTEYVRECCHKSGGDWNTTTETCQAPPAERPPGRQPGPVVAPGQIEDPVVPGAPGPFVPPSGGVAP